MCVCVCDLICKKGHFWQKICDMIYEKRQLLKHHKNIFVYIFAIICTTIHGTASMYTKAFFQVL